MLDVNVVVQIDDGSPSGTKVKVPVSGPPGVSEEYADLDLPTGPIVVRSDEGLIE